MNLRPGRDSDAEGFIGLIGACWAEFPGCIMDVDGELPELRHLATYFAEAGGMLWAAEQDGQLVGMVGTRPLRDDAAWEICRMYVAAPQRGTGLAHRLLDVAEAHARAAGRRPARAAAATRGRRGDPGRPPSRWDAARA